MDADIFVSGKKKLRIQKYPDTCGRGLKKKIKFSSFTFYFKPWRVNQQIGQISRLPKICPAPRQDDGFFEVWPQALTKFGRSKNYRQHLSQGTGDRFPSQNQQKFTQCVWALKERVVGDDFK